MDEPLSNLDAKLRVHMRAEIAELHRQLGATFLYVTHDQVEAMTMSDRVAVMMDGGLLQVAPPRELYAEPADLRVAQFVGSPKINVLPGDRARRRRRRRSRRRACHPQRRIPPTRRFRRRAPRTCAVVAARRPTASAARSAIVENLGADLFVHVETVGAHRIVPAECAARSSLGDPDRRRGRARRGPSRALLFDRAGRRARARPALRERMAETERHRRAVSGAGARRGARGLVLSRAGAAICLLCS